MSEPTSKKSVAMGKLLPFVHSVRFVESHFKRGHTVNVQLAGSVILSAACSCGKAISVQKYQDGKPAIPRVKRIGPRWHGYGGTSTEGISYGLCCDRGHARESAAWTCIAVRMRDLVKPTAQFFQEDVE